MNVDYLFCNSCVSLVSWLEADHMELLPGYLGMLLSQSSEDELSYDTYD